MEFIESTFKLSGLKGYIFKFSIIEILLFELLAVSILFFSVSEAVLQDHTPITIRVQFWKHFFKLGHYMPHRAIDLLKDFPDRVDTHFLVFDILQLVIQVFFYAFDIESNDFGKQVFFKIFHWVDFVEIGEGSRTLEEEVINLFDGFTK